MGCGTTTTNTNTYNPSSMQLYNLLQGALGQSLPSLASLATNPYGSPLYQTMLQPQLSAINQRGQTSMANVTKNLATQGMDTYGNTPAYIQSQLNRTGRAISAQKATAQLGTAQGLQGLGMQGLSMEEGYRPLATGQIQGQQGGAGQLIGQVATALPAILGAFGMGTKPVMGGPGGGPNAKPAANYSQGMTPGNFMTGSPPQPPSLTPNFDALAQNWWQEPSFGS